MVLNWIYIYGHWPVVTVTLVYLALRDERVFARVRNAMFTSGAVGMVIFAVFPTAPPRLAGIGMVDTVSEQSHAYRVLQPPALTNVYASMPSLHVGWNLLMGIAIAREAARPTARWFGALMPIAMYVTVVVTANHYFLDGVVGAAIVVVSLMARRRLPAATAGRLTGRAASAARA